MCVACLSPLLDGVLFVLLLPHGNTDWTTFPTWSSEREGEKLGLSARLTFKTKVIM
jgi:hypothetical protein